MSAIQAARFAVPSSSAPVQPAPWGAGPSSEPQFTLSPMARATGHKTTGFYVMVACSTVTTLVVWQRDPFTGLWGRLASFSNVAPGAIGPFVWAAVCDCLACELWFQTDAASGHGLPAPLVLVEETSG